MIEANYLTRRLTEDEEEFVLKKIGDNWNLKEFRWALEKEVSLNRRVPKTLTQFFRCRFWRGRKLRVKQFINFVVFFPGHGSGLLLRGALRRADYAQKLLVCVAFSMAIAVIFDLLKGCSR